MIGIRLFSMMNASMQRETITPATSEKKRILGSSHGWFGGQTHRPDYAIPHLVW